MKLLHSADLHLDAPFASLPPEQAAALKKALLEIPGQLVRLCRQEDCRMMLLSGDLFDGPYTRQSLEALRDALAGAGVPVFVAPGNHDFCGGESPWLSESWPENVHIFTKPAITSLALPELDCRVYGGGFASMDCPGLLAGFRAEGGERYAIGVLHGDPTRTDSPYCPVTAAQVQESGLDYLALGHIHKGGSFRAGGTLCAWPGCPMGRGFDETGVKGALIVTLEESAEARFVPLDTPRFHDLEAEAGADPAAALAALLPPAGSRDFYRVTLTGESSGVDTEALLSRFSAFPNLRLRDQTTAPVDLWANAGADTLEGVYFQILRDAMEGQEEPVRRRIALAAKISRQILSGQEVVLP